MDYTNFDDILNQVENMVLIFEGQEDDGKRGFIGVDWFTFKGRNILNSYFSGNMWLGFGASEENLKPFRRDGKAYKFYREEGTLFNHYRFLKVRWEGTVVYNSTAETNELIYEVVFFDNQSFYLNVIKTPATDRSATTLVSNKTYTIDLNQIVDRTLEVSFYAENSDETGNDWIVSYDPFVIEVPYIRKFLLASEETYYSIVDDALIEVPITELKASSFLEFGFDTVPHSDSLKQLVNPKVLFWQESIEHELPNLQANITAIPPVQLLEHSVDMNHVTIKSIKSVETDFVGTPLISFSKDGQIWQHYNGSEWVDGFGQIENYTGEVLETWRDSVKNFNIRIQLHENDALKYFKINYEN